MTPVKKGVGDIKRPQRYPFVRLSVCCTPLEPDLCASHVRVGGSVLLSPDGRRRWRADSILVPERTKRDFSYFGPSVKCQQ